MIKDKIIVIQGATGSGKSSLAEMLVEKLNGEIISADSRQVYRYLDIGTAKPDRQTQQKVAYHLIDVVDPDQEYNAGMFVRDALEKIRDIQNRGKTVVIVGGTGFYITALMQGLANIPDISEEAKAKVNEFMQQKENAEIWERLKMIDPAVADKIEFNDNHRIQRALEVYETTGKPLSWWWEQQQAQELISREKYVNIFLNCDRIELYRKINARVDDMLKKGLLKEIENLLKMGYAENAPGMVTVGYREFYPWFKGEGDLDEAIELVKQHTRNYAKRQFTWYRKRFFDLTLDAKLIKISLLLEKIKDFYVKGE